MHQRACRCGMLQAFATTACSTQRTAQALFLDVSWQQHCPGPDARS